MPSRVDSTALSYEETGEVLRSAAGQIDAGRVEKQTNAPDGLVILVANLSTRSFLYVRSPNLPSGWKTPYKE